MFGVTAVLFLGSVMQSGSGWCVVNLNNVQARNITIECNGVNPALLAEVNAELAQKKLEIQQALDRAEKIATRYRALQIELQRLGMNSREAQNAKVLLKNGRLSEAERIIKRLISINKDKWKTFAAAAAQAYFIEGTILQLRDQPEQALPVLYQAYTYQITNQVYAISYGAALAEAGSYGAAESVLRPLIDKTPPPDPKTLYEVAQILAQLSRQTGRPQEALGYYRIATEMGNKFLSPSSDLKFAKVSADFATLLLQLQYSERAATEINRADTAIDSFKGAFNVDALRLALGISNYYLQLSPPNERARVLCDSILNTIQKSALESHSLTLLASATLNLGIYYAKRDDFEDSEKYLQQVSNMIPALLSRGSNDDKPVVDILIAYGRTEVRVGDLHQAISVFTELARLLDQDETRLRTYKLRDLATAYLLLGQVLHRAGMETDAQKALSHAIKAYTQLTEEGAYDTIRDFVDAYQYLELTYEATGQESKMLESLDDEVKTMRLAASADPLHYVSEVPTALAHRAAFFVKRSEWKKAREDITQAEGITRQLIQAGKPVREIFSKIMVSKAVIAILSKSPNACAVAQEATTYATGPDIAKAKYLADKCSYLTTE